MLKTIIYITENRLDEKIADVCRKYLVKAAVDHQIISVSQKPIELGKNICVGNIGRSWLNIYKQQLVGLLAAETEFVAIAEHDVLYTEEHFQFDPPDSDIFYYNDNCWLVEWNGNHPEMNGMYSRWSSDRKALSQLICSKQLLIDSINERLELIESGIRIMRKMGEPGSFPPEIIKAAEIALSDKPYYLQHLLENHITKFKAKSFNTENPNLDIRHKSNFTGPRRGKQRTYEIPYWGKFNKIME